MVNLQLCSVSVCIMLFPNIVIMSSYMYDPQISHKTFWFNGHLDMVIHLHHTVHILT